MQKYWPDGPYFFKSGKREGQCLEILMFQNYPSLLWMFYRLNEKPVKQKNKLHLHLEWLLAQGENRTPVMVCPVCQREKVKFFYVWLYRNYFFVNKSRLSCHRQACIDVMEREEIGWETYPERRELKFSSLGKFRERGDRDLLRELYKKVFSLGHLSREKAFAFFLKD